MCLCVLVDEGIVVPQAILTYRHGPGLGLLGPAPQTYIVGRLTNLLYGPPCSKSPHAGSASIIVALSLFKLVCLQTRLLISIMTYGCFIRWPRFKQWCAYVFLPSCALDQMKYPGT